MVVMPDYFRGGFCEPTKPEFSEFLKRVTVADNIKRDFDAAVEYLAQHLQNLQAQRIAGRLQKGRQAVQILFLRCRV